MKFLKSLLMVYSLILFCLNAKPSYAESCLQRINYDLASINNENQLPNIHANNGINNPSFDIKFLKKNSSWLKQFKYLITASHPVDTYIRNNEYFPSSKNESEKIKEHDSYQKIINTFVKDLVKEYKKVNGHKIFVSTQGIKNIIMEADINGNLCNYYLEILQNHSFTPIINAIFTEELMTKKDKEQNKSIRNSDYNVLPDNCKKYFTKGIHESWKKILTSDGDMQTFYQNLAIICSKCNAAIVPPTYKATGFPKTLTVNRTGCVAAIFKTVASFACV